MSEASCRIDVWLWRARFFKTRVLAARVVEEGRIRRGRHGATDRIDKASRLVKAGDDLVFAHNGRLVCVTVAAAGERRGPPSEARALYRMADEASSAEPQDGAAIDNVTRRLTKTPARAPGFIP